MKATPLDIASPDPIVFAASRPSISFLEDFFGAAPWPLVAIRGRVIHAITLIPAPKRIRAAQEWITRHNGDGYGLYFAPNPLRAALTKKAAKTDIAAAGWLWADVDPPKNLGGVELDAWRYDRRMEFEGPPPGELPEPSFLIDSGRGFWMLWRLRSLSPVDGDEGKLTSKIEAHGRAIEQIFSPWADHCSNIDRVARLPGTINHKTGNIASVLTASDVAYDLADFPAPIAGKLPEPSVAAATPALPIKPHGEAIPFDELPDWLRRGIVAPVDPSADHSERFYAVVTALTERRWTAAQIEDLASRHPNFAPARYVRRLRDEIERCASKSGPSATIARPSARPPASPYPTRALGDVLGPAALAIAERVQCAESLAAQSVLAVASLAAQAVADVRLPYDQTRPLSLFLFSIAQSGDRKTSADREAMTPVKMYERQLRETYELAKRTHDAAFAAWRAQKAQIERGKSTLDARLFELEALGPEPAPPIKPICTVYETTAEGLAKNWPNLPGALGIFSAEGGQFLGGHGFSDEAKLRTAASLSQLWDGDGLRRLRAGDGLVDLHGRRLATHLMIQPEAALSVLADPVLRDQGLLSRILLAAPETLAGTRMWKEPAREFDASLNRYTARLLSIFELPIATANAAGNELTPRALDLSAEAREAWTKFHDDVEASMATKQAFAGLRDVAGKAAEQAARIAGILTIVDDRHATTIDGDVMLRACDLVSWYMGEAVRMDSDVKSAPTLQDAEVLKQWIIGRGLQHVTAAILQKDGPGRLRRKDKLDPAIDALEADGWLIPDGASRRAWRLATAQPQEPQKPQPQPLK